MLTDGSGERFPREKTVVLAPEWRVAKAASKPLLAFFRCRLITLARDNLAVRVPCQPEADCSVAIGGQAFKAGSKGQQVVANIC